MKTIKEMIEVMKAYDEGKTIEFRDFKERDSKWFVCDPDWDWFNCDYRVKEGEPDGLTEDKPKWHDLRKNPNDLPTKSGDYYCKVESIFEKYGVKRFNPEPIREYDSVWEGAGYYVIAWRELPKFEE